MTTTRNALTNRQAVAYLAIASMPGASASGVPGALQLQAMQRLPRADRHAVVGEFAEGVRARMAPDVRALIRDACGAHSV